MPNVYGNAIDLENARKILGNTPGVNFIDTSKGGTYTPGKSDYVVGGTGAVGGLANAGQATRLAGLDRDATTKAIQDAASGIMKSSYANEMTNYQNQLLEAQQAQKQAALRTAYENNSQSLNSQKGTVNNAYSSAINSINATKQAQLPEYQNQRNAASADASQMARKVRELMAATGRYNSGMNRSQQLAVELDRSNAIQGANQAENQFTTQIANQLSNAENQKATSISDIAQKLSLLKNQYNQGTLDLNNQIASEKAAAASKALLEAQNWADTQRQQGVDNSFRQDQQSFSEWLQRENLGLQNKQYDNGLALDIAQLTGMYNGSPTLSAQQMSADNAYRNSQGAQKSQSATQINNERQQLIGQVTSSIYNKVYGQNDSSESALNTLSKNKGAILSDLTSAGMSADEALKWYQSMYNDLIGKY